MNNIDERYQKYLDELKAISIKDVCSLLGIDILKKGNRDWIKIRPENDSSVILNTDKVPNTFHDFGSNQHGDVIALVQAARNVDFKEATKILSDAFGIHLEKSHDPEKRNELSLWEYSKINLYGESARMNFTFDAERLSLERMAELSEKYSMPMNDLRKTHPRIYESLIHSKAVPHVWELRNNYYCAVFAEYYLLKSLGVEDSFCKDSQTLQRFTAQIKELKEAERILKKACERTSIKAYPVGAYDPFRDMKKIKAGEIKPVIGNFSPREMQNIAKAANTNVVPARVDYDKYSADKLEDFPFSAFIDKDKVVIGYLESEREKMKPIFDSMKSPSQNKSLDSKISRAESRQKVQSKESVKQAAIGAER